MKRESIILASVLILVQLCSSVLSAPMTADQAEMVVTGWLEGNSRPLGVSLGRQVMRIETFNNKDDEPIYYIVYLQPSGFVIISADNLVEPIIGFSDDGAYDPSPGNPLGVLVTKDLNRRIEVARSKIRLFSTGTEPPLNENQKKWNSLINRSAESADGLRLMSEVNNLSDVRVAPLVKSYWGTRDSCGFPCFNYYTPRRYYCGPVATAMAQLMRYHKYPVEPNDYDPNEVDGRRRYWIYVEGAVEASPRFLNGGDGSGGPYNWELMPDILNCRHSLEQRQAVGSICYDAGISIDTHYWSRGTSVYFWNARKALMKIFNYTNAVGAYNYSGSYLDIDHDSLMLMVNPNLDAGNPVILAIINGPEEQHAAICDGYGYDNSTMYHHLNLGWDFLPDEIRNVWYELPEISGYCEWEYGGTNYWHDYNFNTICGCIYNIFTSEAGEIISGRVLDLQGEPIENVFITAQSESGGPVYSSVTNDKGIYALKGLRSDTTYAITADKEGYSFNSIEESTDTSVRGSSICGNKWEVNFGDGTSTEIITVGTQTQSWDYPIHTDSHVSRTQVIYLASEIGRDGIIKSLALDIATIPMQSLENWTIRMKHTSMDDYETDGCLLEVDGWIVVYQNDYESVATGWHKFEFQTPFEYNGVDNLMVDFSYNNSFQTENVECKVSNPGSVRSVCACSDGQYGNPLNWLATDSPVTQCSNNVPNVKLTVSKKVVVISECAKLTASDGKRDDFFGCSVSISGDYAIVGAPGPDDDENKYGVAYIFKREGSDWTQHAKLVLPAWERVGDDYYGCSVSISGDYALVGAPGNHPSKQCMGYAYIFKREGSNWVRQADFSGESLDSWELGECVSISGNYAIVGSRQYATSNYGGAAYIFKNEGTNWIQQEKLMDLNSERYDRFGDAVSICGDYVVVATERNCFAVIFLRRLSKKITFSSVACNHFLIRIIHC